MATASPTPLAALSLHNTRTSTVRQRLPLRTAPHRAIAKDALHQSPFSTLGETHGFSANAAPLQNISIGDSSEDEGPPPMVAFSAQTRAILENRPIVGTQSPANLRREHVAPASAQSRRNTPSSDTVRQTTPSRERLRISRRTTPSPGGDERPMRVVRISPRQSSPEAASQDHSFSQQRMTNVAGSHSESSHEYVTPAPGSRVGRSAQLGLAGSVSSSAKQSGNGLSKAQSSPEDKDVAYLEQAHPTDEDDHQAQHNFEVHQPNRARTTNDTVPSLMRVKRVPTNGSFLRGAPMRRGARRRQSDEQQSPVDEHGPQPALGDGPDYESGGEPSHKRPQEPLVIGRDFAASASKATISGSRVPYHRTAPDESFAEKELRAAPQDAQAERPESPPPPQNNDPPREQPRRQKETELVFKVPSRPLEGFYDQENDPPPTFRRKPSTVGVLAQKSDILQDGKPLVILADAPKSPHRPALATLSRNTPARPAPPPPPKMSVLETATVSAGASTVKSKKKRSHVTVNGKVFALRGRLGKGGSSDVWRVMAENDKMFALKKVNLADCNEETVRSFKGEIDLLQKLEDNDRVVRLFDYEVNEQKQQLSVLMEMGESDLNRVLGGRILPDDAKLDLAFTRFYWREMLECVAAVHAHDIVHSDLKPPNFLLVQGRLKLIDFGIANAIDVDNTVNVHRDTNVGTPNYMSPESLQDSNEGKRAPGQPKLMKLGKPSDVWSLGCILYQMTYGKPPFGHIANQWNRVMAIVNPDVQIQYPQHGIGGVIVPLSLRNILRRCLNRDSRQRPTIAQMLDSSEPFLHPDSQQQQQYQFDDNRVPMTEEMLAQILRNVINRCKDPKRGIPSEAELRAYPKGFMDRIRASLDKN